MNQRKWLANNYMNVTAWHSRCFDLNKTRWQHNGRTGR